MIPPDKEIWYGIAFIHGRTSEFWQVSDIQAVKLGSVETTTQKRQRKGLVDLRSIDPKGGWFIISKNFALERK